MEERVIITTGDLKEDYEIIGPVYFKVSNKGIFKDELLTYEKQYREKFAEMREKGTMSQMRLDWGFLYGDYSVGQDRFETAFYIACEELKKRARMLGGDAIVAMRQDIDIDSNGIGNFYLQMYGTVVRRNFNQVNDDFFESLPEI